MGLVLDREETREKPGKVQEERSRKIQVAEHGKTDVLHFRAGRVNVYALLFPAAVSGRGIEEGFSRRPAGEKRIEDGGNGYAPPRFPIFSPNRQGRKTPGRKRRQAKASSAENAAYVSSIPSEYKGQHACRRPKQGRTAFSSSAGAGPAVRITQTADFPPRITALSFVHGG